MDYRSQVTESLDRGDIVPGVLCPTCGGETVYTSTGALCEDCSHFVPVVGEAVHLDVDDDEESDWDDDEGVSESHG